MSEGAPDSTEAESASFRIVYTDTAEAQVEQAYLWLMNRSYVAAEH